MVASAGLVVLLSGCAPSVPGYEGADFANMTAGERAQYVFECMRHKGWDVTLTDDGGIFSEGDASQDGAYGLDWSACNAPLRDAAVPKTEWSEASWDELYDKVTSEAECLENLG